MNALAPPQRVLEPLEDHGEYLAKVAATDNPQSELMEQAVLGSLLMDAVGAWEACRVAELVPADFFDDRHEFIFAAIAERVQAGQQVDELLVHEHLRAAGRDAYCGGLKYLASLGGGVFNPRMAADYARQVRHLAIRRRLLRGLEEMQTQVRNGMDPGEVLDQAAGILQGVRSGTGVLPRPLEWVDAARNWKPLTDLQVRKIVVRWAVDGLIQAGKVGALVAAGGTGKTTILLTLAICIATGRAFMGLQVRQGTFVLLSNDDPQEDLESALVLVARAMKLTPAECEQVQQKVRVLSLQGLAGEKVFTYPGGGGVVAAGLERRILEALAGIDDLVGISLDTLRQFSGGSSNDEQVIKLTIAGATEIAVKTGAFVILPHHTGKQNYRDGIADQYAGSGSAAIADNCRFVLVLQTATWPDIETKVKRTGQEAGDPLVLMSTRGSLLVKAPPPIYLHRNDYLIERVAGDVMTQGQVADARDRKVLEAIRRGAQSKRAIRAEVRGNARALDALVDDLAARGLIEPGGGSAGGSEKWVVSAAGARVLEAFNAAV